MGRGLQTAMVLFHDPSVRPGVPHVLIAVSYAPSADNFLLPSLTMRHDGIDIFGVGVGKYFSKMQLLFLTSIPKFRHLFKAKSSSQLKCLAASVADKVIRGTNTANSLRLSSEGQRSKLRNLELQDRKEYWGIFIPY